MENVTIPAATAPMIAITSRLTTSDELRRPAGDIAHLGLRSLHLGSVFGQACLHLGILAHGMGDGLGCFERDFIGHTRMSKEVVGAILLSAS